MLVAEQVNVEDAVDVLDELLVELVVDDEMEVEALDVELLVLEELEADVEDELEVEDAAFEEDEVVEPDAFELVVEELVWEDEPVEEVDEVEEDDFPPESAKYAPAPPTTTTIRTIMTSATVAMPRLRFTIILESGWREEDISDSASNGPLKSGFRP